MRLLLLILILACVAIQYPLWWGDSGYARVKELQEQITRIEENNRALEVRNNAMLAEIVDLRSGTQAMEEKARDQLNLVKDGETFVQILYPNDPVVEPRSLPINQPLNPTTSKFEQKASQLPSAKTPKPAAKLNSSKTNPNKLYSSKVPASKLQANKSSTQSTTPKISKSQTTKVQSRP